MIKIIVDILMFVALILEFSKLYLSPLIHEVLGISIAILIITHLVLNRNYIKNIFNGKYNASRAIMLIVNSLLFISILLAITCGIIISKVLFKDIGGYDINVSRLHIISSFVSILMLGLHLGLNLKQITGKIKILNNKIIEITLHIIIVIIGLYAIYKTSYFDYLFGINTFFSKDSNLIVNFLLYSFVTLFFSIIMYYINKIIIKISNVKK